MKKAYAEVKAAEAAGVPIQLQWEREREAAESQEEPADEFEDLEDLFTELFGSMPGGKNPHKPGPDAEGFEHGERAWQGSPVKPRMQGASGGASEYLKSIYRKLVRILHPDSNQNENKVQRDLWHEVQEAYGLQDVQRLERLLAKATGSARGALDLDSAPISHIMDLRRDVERRLRKLKQQLSLARRQPQWGFLALKADPRRLARLRYGIASDLDEDRRAIQADLSDLRRQIAIWERPAPRKNPGKKAPSRSASIKSAEPVSL